jgi:hypothetical protein
MNLEQNLIAALNADPTYAALVTGRTWLIQLPQNPAFPGAAIQRVGDQPLYMHAPPGYAPQATVGQARLLYKCWVKNDTSAGIIADQIRLAVKNVLRSFSAWGSPLTGSPSRIINDSFGIDPETQPPLFLLFMDLSFWYQEN